LSEEEVIARSPVPVTRQSLVTDLRRLGVEQGMVLLIHSSLSALGWVCGGPVAVIQALMEVVTPGGTLMMPAHSGDLSDPAQWRNPPVPPDWVPLIRAAMPAFEPRLTPTSGMGRIAESFRTWPGVVRSAHPQTSFAAWGRHAAFLTEGHAIDDSLGETSPLARLYDRDGHVLLLGVGYDRNTSYHLAEYRAGRAAVTEQGAPILRDGDRVWVTLRDIVLDEEPFPEIGAAFERDHPEAVHRGRVGLAEARLFLQLPAVEYAVRWLRDRPVTS
jgi:aminoglycoside 3-N-acetyltransferase